MTDDADVTGRTERPGFLDRGAEPTGFEPTGFEPTGFESDGTHPTGFGSDGTHPTVPPTKREREAGWLHSALLLRDLTEVPIEELRLLANRMFRLLDSDRPPFEAAERYTAAVAEIEARERDQIARGGPGGKPRPVFKDSAFGSRLELFLDGSLAAYIRYSLVGSQLTLRILVESPGFEGRGLAPVLLRHAMLHAHRRRLGVIAACAAAQAFLEQNPQYRTLARTVHEQDEQQRRG